MRARDLSSFFLSLCFLLFAQIVPGRSFAQKKELKHRLPKDNKSLYLRAGLPGEFIHENIDQETAKKFNFRYYRYAGCLSPEDWHKDAQKHNRQLNKRISRQFGDDWKTHYKNEYSRLADLFHRSESILSYDSFFWIGREQSLAPPMDIEQTYYSELYLDSIILITICSINEWTLNNKLVAFRQFELNLRTKKVTLIANIPKEESLTSVNQ